MNGMYSLLNIFIPFAKNNLKKINFEEKYKNMERLNPTLTCVSSNHVFLLCWLSARLVKRFKADVPDSNFGCFS